MRCRRCNYTLRKLPKLPAEFDFYIVCNVCNLQRHYDKWGFELKENTQNG